MYRLKGRIVFIFRWLHHDCPKRRESITKLLEGFDLNNPAFDEVEICSEVLERFPALKENQKKKADRKAAVES